MTVRQSRLKSCVLSSAGELSQSHLSSTREFWGETNYWPEDFFLISVLILGQHCRWECMCFWVCVSLCKSMFHRTDFWFPAILGENWCSDVGCRNEAFKWELIVFRHIVYGNASIQMSGFHFLVPFVRKAVSFYCDMRKYAILVMSGLELIMSMS